MADGRDDAAPDEGGDGRHRKAWPGTAAHGDGGGGDKMGGMTARRVFSRPRLLASALMAVSSALLFMVFVFEDLSAMLDTAWSDVPWRLVLRYALSMGIAGALIGALLAGAFGRAGLAGWALSLAGGIVTATVAGLLGSFFGLQPGLFSGGADAGDVIAILAGGLVLPFAVAEWPVVGALWLAFLAATHVSIRRLRG